MTKINGKVEELLAKHPNLSQAEAIKIVTDKNERKKKKRIEKTARSNVNNTKKEVTVPNEDEV
jgi:ribosomal protein L6P/L9E